VLSLALPRPNQLGTGLVLTMLSIADFGSLEMALPFHRGGDETAHSGTKACS